MSWEALNEPFPWYDDGAPVGGYVLGNTCGHYELHSEWIQRWIDAQSA
jgi:hypothetical protein